MHKVESEIDLHQVDDDEYPISEEEQDEDEEDDEEEAESGNVKKKAWSMSIAKVLNSDKSGVLSKAKKVENIEEKKKEKKSCTFEIDGEVKKEEKPDEKALQIAIERRKRKEKREDKIKVFNLRMKPSIADLDRERTFRKIATRGVVQLFNAVKNQNADMEKKLETVKIDSKRDEIIKSADNKRNFIDKLMSGSRAKSELVDKGVKKEKNDEDSTWNALNDNFFTKRGWDNDDDESDDSNNEPMDESDSE